MRFNVAAMLLRFIRSNFSRRPPTEPVTATHTEAALRQHVLSKWFPAAVDDAGGGFFENYSLDWTRINPTDLRSIVYQSRLTWLAAHAARRLPQESEKYLSYSRHGVKFLADRLWDQQRGGFYWQVDTTGAPARERGTEKHAYGIAFAIYALSASYHATHDPASLDLAGKAFTWLDEHARDATNGGYFEALTAEGAPILSGNGNDAIGTQYGRKSMNAHIHLLEAFGELYRVWPDALLRSRMTELFEIVRDKVYADPGYLTLHFTADWRRVPGRDSFGHDIEAAYLLTEVAAILGIPDDPATWANGRKLVDHALRVGFDHKRGGFYNEGTIAGENLITEKIWWVQAEGLNALLLMHERFGGETGQYWDAFVKQWDFIAKHQIDQKRGGWYPAVNAAGSPSRRVRVKSDQWTEGYHQGRALMNVTQTLRKLAGRGN